MSARPFDVAVAGAGVMGLACAYEEARRGQKVFVADSRPEGGGASYAAAGLVVTRNPRRFFSPFREFTIRSATLYPSWIADLCKVAGQSVQLRRTPAIHLYHLSTDVGRAKFEDEVVRLSREEAYDYEMVREVPAEIKNIVRAGDWAVIRFREELSLDPQTLLSVLRAACLKLGVEFMEPAPVESLQVEGGCVRFRAGEKEFSSGHFIIAAGVRSDDLLKSLNLTSGLVPIKGQAFLIENTRSLDLTVHYNQRLFLSPRGQWLYAGTTKEKGVWEESYDPARERDLREEFSAWLDLPLPATMQTFSGLRPRTRDRLPLIGFVTSGKNISICAGHYKSGVALAPLSAQSLSCLIHGETPSFDISPFNPFRPRALKTVLP